MFGVGIAERGENFSPDPEIGVAHVRAFRNFGETERELAKLRDESPHACRRSFRKACRFSVYQLRRQQVCVRDLLCADYLKSESPRRSASRRLLPSARAWKRRDRRRTRKR